MPASGSTIPVWEDLTTVGLYNAAAEAFLGYRLHGSQRMAREVRLALREFMFRLQTALLEELTVTTGPAEATVTKVGGATLTSLGENSVLYPAEGLEMETA